jgi:Arc/MetJ family transcription regulator
MRTNIVIDDKLMKDALRTTGAKTKREAVELGLRTTTVRSNVEQNQLVSVIGSFESGLVGLQGA